MEGKKYSVEWRKTSENNGKEKPMTKTKRPQGRDRISSGGEKDKNSRRIMFSI